MPDAPTCDQCSRENPPSSRYCAGCGAALPGESSPIADAHRTAKATAGVPAWRRWAAHPGVRLTAASLVLGTLIVAGGLFWSPLGGSDGVAPLQITLGTCTASEGDSSPVSAMKYPASWQAVADRPACSGFEDPSAAGDATTALRIDLICTRDDDCVEGATAFEKAAAFRQQALDSDTFPVDQASDVTLAVIGGEECAAFTSAQRFGGAPDYPYDSRNYTAVCSTHGGWTLVTASSDPSGWPLAERIFLEMLRSLTWSAGV